MELQSATIRNIQFAWSRILDIDEEEMADASTRTYRESRDSPLLMFVSLFGKGVLVGPAWAMAAARTLTDAQLARHSVLLDLSRPHNGQALGEASLFFCDTVPPAADPPLPVSLGRNDAVMLESACLPEDAEEAGLSGTEHVWILMDGRESPARPVAGAGYNVWAGALAHKGVLTAPGDRSEDTVCVFPSWPRRRPSLLASSRSGVPGRTTLRPAGRPCGRALSMPAARQASSFRPQGPDPARSQKCDTPRTPLVRNELESS